MPAPRHSTRRRPRSAALDVWLALAMAAALLALGLSHLHRVASRAMTWEVICGLLLDNRTEGRQALVSSVWWPPLPVLTRLPLVSLLRGVDIPLASLLVSSLCGGAALVVLNRILRRWHAGIARVLILAALAVNPLFINECLGGGSGPSVMLLTILTAYGLAEWTGAQQIRYLVFLGVGAALLLLENFEMAPWVAAVFALACLDGLFRRTSLAQKNAGMILLLLPTLYAAGLWLLMNWLIMGDALYFLRALHGAVTTHDWHALRLGNLPPGHYVPAGVSALALLIALCDRSRGGVVLALVSAGPVLVADLLAGWGFGWAIEPVLLALYPLCFLAMGHATGELAERGSVLRVLTPLTPVAVTVAVFLSPGSWSVIRPEGSRFEAALAERNEWLPRIERHVLRESPHATVYACGYESFAFLGRQRADSVFVPSLDFDFAKAAHDYPGRRLYLLVRRPEGRSGMDSIHWKYDRLHEYGARGALYDGDWGPWRLFQIVQAPRWVPRPVIEELE